MAKCPHSPARRGDVPEPPVTGRRKGAALALGVGLALLSAFISLPAQAAVAAEKLYISGGGGGGGGSLSDDSDGGDGGEHAATGNGSDDGGNGGGAYVGNGTDEANSPKGLKDTAPHPSVGVSEAEDGVGGDGTTGGSGGNASFEAPELSGYDIYVQSGNDGYDGGLGDITPGGPGGDATLTVTGTVITDILEVQSGHPDQDPTGAGKASVTIGTLQGTIDGKAIYTFTKHAGSLSVNITTLDATKGDVEFTVDNAKTATGDVVLIRNLELGGEKTFTVDRRNSGEFTIERYRVGGKAKWMGGRLDAASRRMDFYIPSDMEKNETMLKVIGGADITNAEVNVGIDGGSSLLKAGDQIILIDADALDGVPANDTSKGQDMQDKLGVILLYDFDLIKEGNQLIATVSGPDPDPGPGPRVNPQTKALSEGFLGGAILVKQGGDLAAGQGMSQAVGATQGAGFGAFGALSGGQSRYRTGSHIDMSSVSLLTGLARGTDLQPGRLTLGAFFEYGNGAYDTCNSFANAASVKGNGNAYYVGGGVLGRMDFVDTGPGNFHAETTGRAGGLHNNYKNGDLRDFQGRKAEYTSNSTY